MSVVNTACPAGTNDEAPAGDGTTLQWIAFEPHGDDSRPAVATVRAAVVEFWFFEHELRCIEADVAAAWPHVDAHTPLATSGG